MRLNPKWWYDKTYGPDWSDIVYEEDMRKLKEQQRYQAEFEKQTREIKRMWNAPESWASNEISKQ